MLKVTATHLEMIKKTRYTSKGTCGKNYNEGKDMR